MMGRGIQRGVEEIVGVHLSREGEMIFVSFIGEIGCGVEKQFS